MRITSRHQANLRHQSRRSVKHRVEVASGKLQDACIASCELLTSTAGSAHSLKSTWDKYAQDARKDMRKLMHTPASHGDSERERSGNRACYEILHLADCCCVRWRVKKARTGQYEKSSMPRLTTFLTLITPTPAQATGSSLHHRHHPMEDNNAIRQHVLHSRGSGKRWHITQKSRELIYSQAKQCTTTIRHTSTVELRNGNAARRGTASRQQSIPSQLRLMLVIVTIMSSVVDQRKCRHLTQHTRRRSFSSIAAR